MRRGRETSRSLHVWGPRAGGAVPLTPSPRVRTRGGCCPRPPSQAAGRPSLALTTLHPDHRLLASGAMGKHVSVFGHLVPAVLA